MQIRATIRRFHRKLHEVDQEFAVSDVLDCAVGCNALGTSPKVVEAANKYRWATLSTYPDTSYAALKNQICRFWSDHAQLSPANIKVANGAAVILSRLNKLFIEPRTKSLGYAPQFKDFSEEVLILGGRHDMVLLDPLDGFKFSTERFIEAIDSNHSVVYLDNPNNPTGQYINLVDIENIVSVAASQDIVVILDEAYGDYVAESGSAVNLLDRYPNLVVTRTFSKGMGIAQFRVGYGIMSTELARYYDRVDLPFQISSIAAFLAGESLSDHGFVRRNRAQLAGENKALTEGLVERGYTVAETHETCPIFLLGHRDREIDLRERLLGRGIRTISGADFDNLGSQYVRVNTPASAEEFLARLDA